MLTKDIIKLLEAENTYKKYEEEILDLYKKLKQNLSSGQKADLMRYDELTCAQNAFVIDFVIKNLHHFVPLKIPQNIT